MDSSHQEDSKGPVVESAATIAAVIGTVFAGAAFVSTVIQLISSDSARATNLEIAISDDLPIRLEEVTGTNFLHGEQKESDFVIPSGSKGGVRCGSHGTLTGLEAKFGYNIYQLIRPTEKKQIAILYIWVDNPYSGSNKSDCRIGHYPEASFNRDSSRKIVGVNGPNEWSGTVGSGGNASIGFIELENHSPAYCYIECGSGNHNVVRIAISNFSA